MYYIAVAIYYIAVRYIVSYCIKLQCIIIALRRNVLYCITMYYIALSYNVLYCIKLQCIILH